MGHRLLVVHAHPDDESSKGAATAAAYVARGARVLVVSCTGGESGDVLNEQLDPVAKVRAARDMAGLRRDEMAGAQAALGIEHRWLGYRDSGLPPEGVPVPPNSFAAIPVELEARPLVRLIREFRPQVVVAYDEEGGYPHPDHIRAHEVAVLAIEQAADADAFPDTGDAWQVSKLYYDRVFSAERGAAVLAAMRAQEPAHPLADQLAEMLQWRGRKPMTLTTRVPVGQFFEARDAALRSHASQVNADSPFFFWPNDLQRAAWPTEDYELVWSKVPTELPEDDLFAGIPDEPDEEAR